MESWFDVSTRMGLTVVTALVSTLASFLFWGLLDGWRVRRIRRRIERQVKEGRSSVDGPSVALVLSVGRDVAPDVRRHLDDNAFTRGMLLLQVHQAGGLELREENWIHYLERVKKEWRRIVQDGFRRVLLFVNMPVAMAVYAGAVLMPGPEVVVFHFQENVYHRTGSLTTALVKL
jgi:hypothetical protein